MSVALAGRHIGLLTASASRLGGGVFEAVASHARLLVEFGAQVTVFALHDEHADADKARFGAAQVITCPVHGPRQMGYAPALVHALLNAELDMLHLHGIWMYPSHAGRTWAARSGRPYVISPHGMLDPWITGRGRWKKALARMGYERASWAAATCFHALTPREATDIARESGRADSIVIPNPGPAAVAPPAAMPAPEIAYIGRIHIKKNLLALVAGWAQSTRPAGARLRIAGWGDQADVAALTAAVAGVPDVEFLGPVYGADKAALLAEARFGILPSHSEGLPMSVLETWAAGKPMLMTGECNLPEGFAAGAAIDCGYQSDSISAALTRAFALGDAKWHGMAEAAAGLAKGPFSALGVARKWERAYLDVL